MDPRTGAIEALKTDPETVSLRRSLEVYYGDPAREAAMDAFYARFVRPGDLVFDVGAHVGDRVGSFRRLGARVIAVEPQPPCIRALRAIYARDPEVTVVEAVCGGQAGRIPFNVNSANPTISTASPLFIRAADGAAGWAHERWDAQIEVDSVTLDGLIAEHGAPAFVKIDVEGFEDVVLSGLTRPLPALSFEFTTIEREVAQRCLRRLSALGVHAYNVALGDTMALASGQWMSAARMAAYLRSLPYTANSGDVYCVSRSHPRPTD
ncbi:FkbM family methyltransferase [Micromonospora sp. NPDC048909]|uniref:FkbM family methyltransferase n=1 Tax=Micromonospora sp. NPDC048909 TaxID=3155643 RepID=UPI0034076FC0